MKLEILSTRTWAVPYGTTDADLERMEQQLAQKGKVANVLWKGDPMDRQVTVFIYKRV